jgi:hypothetical protein
MKRQVRFSEMEYEEHRRCEENKGVRKAHFILFL